MARSPAGKHVMVRRVAALEAAEMVTDDPEEPPLRIPPGHCWVLADNPELQPPDVIDSRAFGGSRGGAAGAARSRPLAPLRLGGRACGRGPSQIAAAAAWVGAWG
jgi:hypothetical protein